MRGNLGLVGVACVAAACGGGDHGGDAELCAGAFEELDDLWAFPANAGMGGDVFTIVTEGRAARGQLIFHRRDFDGNILVREEELTADGVDTGYVWFSDTGDHVAWIEGYDPPRRLVMGRITSDGAVVDVVEVDPPGTFALPYALVETTPGTVAVLLGEQAELLLTFVSGGRLTPRVRIGTLVANPFVTPTMIAGDGELAIAWTNEQGAFFERRAFDGAQLAPTISVAPGTPLVHAMCWDGDSYQIVVEDGAVALVRHDRVTTTEPRVLTDEDARFPAILCRDDGGPSLLAHTQVLTRTSDGNVETASIVARRLDRSGTPLAPQVPISTRTDALDIEPRLHGARDGTVVVIWDEYTASPSGVALAAARCRP